MATETPSIKHPEVDKKKDQVALIGAAVEFLAGVITIFLGFFEKHVVAGILALAVGIGGLAAIAWTGPRRTIPRVLLAFLAAFLVVVGVIFLFFSGDTPAPTPTATTVAMVSPPEPEQEAVSTEIPTIAPKQVDSYFDFEEEQQGWIAQVYTNTMGVVDIDRSCQEAKTGNCSLMLKVDLNGPDYSKRSGEAYVDLRADPPLEVVAPVDLTGRTITCWIKLSNNSLEGKRDAWNGVQLFAKSVDGEIWSSEYGTWRNLGEKTGDWFSVSLSPSMAPQPTPHWGYRDDNFNPLQVSIIGVKIAINEKSTASGKGEVYIDACDW